MLSINRLSKNFGDLKAVNELSFEVPDGEIVGFVGANGAGKSTTMRIAMGVLSASSGEVLWDGAPISRDNQRSIGYMPEERGLYPKMKVGDQLIYLARLHGLDKATAAKAVDHWLAALNLSERKNDQLQKLSLGNQQRVQLAAALVFDPTFLILDEPFSGLDPVAVEVMSQVLIERAQSGVATLFSSHQLDLVERLCDRVVIIREGRLVANDTVANLKEKGTSTFRLVTNCPAQTLEELLRELQIPASTEIGKDLSQVSLTWDGTKSQELLGQVLKHGQVLEYGPIVPSLTDLFKTVVQAPKEEEESK
ncbi:ABC transporter ATP-binding protein [Boudabousia tangfeifanii]|uniref:ABC transporter ATP-binding protein n=1 Tax=Boudabousia tangfeifanii TaxID=1912795 RepID=A0A1D9MM61_9ACTO|nr:ATP-binding cassette domain-containing protein [Boudabousia tangfeifanii]AOZ73279.1 ABC transporter ATP-binding protein [Boudabousia tangfeifanii]